MNSNPPSKLEKLKQALQVIAGFVAILKWIPIPGWRNGLLALSAALGMIIGALEKCDSTHQQDSQLPKSPTATVTAPIQTATPTHTPTPTPTPVPVEIIVPEKIVAKEPFIVRVTAPFAYNTDLMVDRFHLCILGQEYKTKLMRCTVTLWTTGRRVLRVKLSNGQTIEKWITVSP